MGYTGIIVTEHNWGGNTSADRSLPWESWIDAPMQGYEDARRYGEKHDLDVFWAYEAGYGGTDFLIYGITPEWLKAHPFREEPHIPEIRLFPEYVDGVEGFNATHSNRRSISSHNKPEFDQRAIAYANEHHLPITAGSDIHNKNLLGGGIALKRRLTSTKDYCQILLGGEDYVLTNGDGVFDKYGNPI